MKRILFLLAVVLSNSISHAQVITYEDSLNAGLVRKSNPTVISGYGEAKFSYLKENQTGKANIPRAIIFLGHRFNEKIQFFSEWELENAKLAGGASGEFSLEQFLLKFNINKDIYLVSGLFVPRIGIINENHLPTTFNGNDRPFLETSLIPATWREIGVGLYGNSNKIVGLNYSIALVNGLNCSKFSNGDGIRSGRAEGSEASAKNIALTASLLYYRSGLRLQASTYYGGSSGVSNRVSDSLQLSTGPFAIPVNLSEINLQYRIRGVTFKALAAHCMIKDAKTLNTVYANNTPRQMLGAYAELAYDLFNKKYNGEKSLNLFVRYERINLDYEVVSNGIENGPNNQSHIVAGITYAPIRGVAIKFDYHNNTNGQINPALITTPFPQMPTYFAIRNYVNLGFGYSF